MSVYSPAKEELNPGSGAWASTTALPAGTRGTRNGSQTCERTCFVAGFFLQGWLRGGEGPCGQLTLLAE